MSLFLKNKNQHRLVLVASFFFSFVIFFSVGAKQTQASTPFGGRIGSVIFCTCSGSFLVNVGPPVGGSFLYRPGISKLYDWGQITRPGVWVLGQAKPGGACLIRVSKVCVPIPASGTIEQVGTSL